MNNLKLTPQQAANPFIAMLYARMTGGSNEDVLDAACKAGMNTVQTDQQPANECNNQKDVEADRVNTQPKRYKSPAALTARDANEAISVARQALDLHIKLAVQLSRSSIFDDDDGTYWEALEGIEDSLALLRDGLKLRRSMADESAHRRIFGPRRNKRVA